MKINRTQNATRNIAFGVVLRIYQMLMPFVMRTIMIYLLGVNYLGLNSLFTSILQVLNLAEMGVGLAMVYSMYEPIAKDDSEKVCALMQLYKVYYRVIGAVVLIGGCLVIPFLPKLIKSDIPPDMNIYILYILNLLATVLTYWLFAYKNSILYAHQRADISTKVAIITETIKYLLQIVVLAVFQSYYLYTIVIVATQILTNIITAVVAGKIYPQYKASGKLSKEEVRQINAKIRDLFTSKLGTVVFNSVDTIIISAFLGLRILAIYQNYYFIVTSVTSLISIIFSSSTAGIGNSLIIESEEKNYNDFKKFTLIIIWISGFCTMCMLCLFQPFMKIWVTEKLMLEFHAVILFCIYFFVNQINLLMEAYKDAAGMWHEDRFRPLTLSVINLVLNLILVQFIGVYGVLLASCITKAFIGIPWVIYNLFHVVFRQNVSEYIKKLCLDISIVLVVSVCIYKLCLLIPLEGIIGLGIKCIICCLGGNLLYLMAFRLDKEYKSVILIGKSILPRRLKRIVDTIV